MSTTSSLQEVIENTEPNERKVVRQEIRLIDQNGEIIVEHSSKVRNKNGGGFVLSYMSKATDLMIKCTSPSALRIFGIIAHKQTYTGGFRTNKKYFQDVLHIDRKSVYSGLKWLEENNIINVLRIDGSLEFMVNPEYVTIGTDKTARTRIWYERCREANRRKHPELIVH